MFPFNFVLLVFLYLFHYFSFLESLFSWKKLIFWLIFVLSKKFGAAVVSLEHCYYGKISPFNLLTTENLRYFSSKHGLFDLAIFRQYYQVKITFLIDEFGAKNVLSGTCVSEVSIYLKKVWDSFNLRLIMKNIENPWFFFGVSYPKALSAWFHLKFLQVLLFLATDGKEAKPLFGAAELEINGDFFYFLADATTIGFQYGNHGIVCSSLVEAKKNGDDLVESYAKYFGVSVGTYNQEHLKNTTLTGFSSDLCTEVAYFQVALSNDSIRSSKVDARHILKTTNVSGEGIYLDVTAANIYYGSTNIGGRQIIFTNGSQDPWRHASKQPSSPDCDALFNKKLVHGFGYNIQGLGKSLEKISTLKSVRSEHKPKSKLEISKI
ncbi:hypothetical protein UlMin_016434 [Ulmus minor]